jgi:hypothetical protein
MTTDVFRSWGLKKTIEAPRASDGTQRALEVKLDGAPRGNFELMSTVPATGIERLSFHYDYMKFNDEHVRFVSYQTHLINGPSDLDIRAFIKINGQWREEDWTDFSDEDSDGDFVRSYCRDERDEHIEELVLVYSNGNPDRPSDPIVMHRKPRLWVSNGSCFRWTGTSRVVETNSKGGVQQGTATVTFEVDKSLKGTTGYHRSRTFRPVSGTATLERSGPDFSGLCQLTYPFTSAAIKPSEGSITIAYAEPGTSNTLFGGGISGIQTTITVQCGSGEPETQVGTVPSMWLMFPLTGTALGPDGKSFSGSTTLVGTGKSTTGHWQFVAQTQN